MVFYSVFGLNTPQLAALLCFQKLWGMKPTSKSISSRNTIPRSLLRVFYSLFFIPYSLFPILSSLVTSFIAHSSFLIAHLKRSFPWVKSRFLCVAGFCLLPAALFAEEPLPDFASIESVMDGIESLLLDTIGTNETQQRQLNDLSQTLSERERLIEEQGNSLRTLRTDLGGMSETWKKLSDYSKSLEQKSAFWKRFSIIGLPLAALLGAGITAGVILSQ
jgi:hypothetical protein